MKQERYIKRCPLRIFCIIVHAAKLVSTSVSVKSVMVNIRRVMHNIIQLIHILSFTEVLHWGTHRWRSHEHCPGGWGDSSASVSHRHPQRTHPSLQPSSRHSGAQSRHTHPRSRTIWALSGWGSRLYSLVGGTAPCSGDNYTVYCLPGQTHSTLKIQRLIGVKLMWLITAFVLFFKLFQ